MKRTLYLVIIAVLVLVLCVTAFAACKDKNKDPEHLAPVDGNTISYDGDVLTWGAIDHAEGYWIYLNDSTEYYATQEARLDLRLSEDVTFSILSVANNADYISAESKGSASFTYIPMVESITVRKRTTDKAVGQSPNGENDTSFDYFTWNAVEAADSYLLKENGETETRSYKPDENSGVLAQPIGATFNAEGGVASLSVKPQSETARTYSHWSDVKTVTVLADPSNFGFNPENSLISWKNVSNAVAYEIKVGTNIDAIEDWRAVTNNFFVYGQNVNNFKMKVKAIGNYDADVLDSRLVERSFQELPALQGMSVNFGELVWNPIATVSEYQVRISVTVVKGDSEPTVKNLVDTVVTGSSYTGAFEAFLDEQTYGMSSEISYTPSSYVAYVRPVIASSETLGGAEDIVSYANWTKADFTLLQTPELIYSGNETFTWNPIPGAASYNVWLYRNGVNIKNEVRTEDQNFQFSYNFSENSGTYELRIASLSGVDTNTNGNNGSRKSDAFTIIVISAPSEYTMMSSEYDAATGASQTEDNAAALNFFFNDVYGADYYVASRYYDLVATDSDGDGKVDVDGDSISSSTKLEYDTVNASETVGPDAAKGKYNVSVNTVIAGADGRSDTIFLYAKSSLSSTGKITYVEKYQLSDNTYAFREFVPYVDENGNEVTTSRMIILDGDDSTPIQITQLPSPQKVTLTGNAVTWEKVSRASGYEVKIIRKDIADAQGEVVPCYSNHYNLDFDEAGEYEISVRAKGNGNILLSSIFGSPLSVIKLPVVEDVRVENQGGNTVLAWNTSSFRYGDVDYYPTRYEVRVGNYLIYDGVSNFAALEGQKQYFNSEGSACTVTAIADNYQISDHAFIIDSEKSDTVVVFKLGVPQNLTMQNNVLTWSYDGNARGFKIYDGSNEVARTTATQLVISEENGFTKDIYSGKECSFTVVAVMDITNGSEDSNPYYKESNAFYVDSEDSVMLNLTMLSTPQVVVAQDTGAATWNKVVGASSYIVKVQDIANNGESNYIVTDTSSSNTISFVPTVLTGDKSTVRISVTAIGNNIKYFNSFPFYYETKVEKLGALNKKGGQIFSIKVNYNEETGVATSFTVHVFDADDEETKTKGRGYIVNIGGLEHFTADGNYTVEDLNVGNYTINVCAAGNNYEGEVTDEFQNNLLYINGDYDENFERNIYVLGAPRESDVSVSYGGLGDLTKRLVYFPVIPNAVGYKLSYKYQKLEDSGEYSDIQDANGVIEFTVGSNGTKGYIEKQFETDSLGRVCFVLDNIDENVDLAVLTIQVLGDGENSVSNSQITVPYSVR